MEVYKWCWQWSWFDMCWAKSKQNFYFTWYETWLVKLTQLKNLIKTRLGSKSTNPCSFYILKKPLPNLSRWVTCLTWPIATSECAGRKIGPQKNVANQENTSYTLNMVSCNEIILQKSDRDSIIIVAWDC